MSDFKQAVEVDPVAKRGMREMGMGRVRDVGALGGGGIERMSG